ncbi:hypothetical protein F1F76_15700 [Listeria monocytogenes]|nr:hypothetical protein [Listeria monocytogenes]ECR2455953.1 hypothetical protein [Listeria monocytogenes]ECR2513528.1 hypothetical protein [Listeria monocytogenes]
MIEFKKNIVLALVLSTFLLVGCNQSAEKEDGYYFYALNYIEGGTGADNEINFYVIKPFEETVLATVLGINDSDAVYELEDFNDKEDMLTFKFNGVTETFEKESDSHWRSLETGIEYDVNKITEKPDHES